jgi:hypothetical protein
VFPQVLFLVVVAATIVSAQGRGGQEFPPPSIGGTQTPFEQFADKLDLDRRTQFPEAEKIFVEASRQAPPIAQQIQQLRVRLVNAEIEKNDADVNAILSEYRAVAAQMAALEAQTFAKVHALLKPNQTKNATEAFGLIAGVFIPPPPAAARVPRR